MVVIFDEVVKEEISVLVNAPEGMTIASVEMLARCSVPGLSACNKVRSVRHIAGDAAAVAAYGKADWVVSVGVNGETVLGMNDRVFEVLREVLAELNSATGKFPTWPTDPVHAGAVVVEELGELMKAVLEQTYEPMKAKPDQVRKEAVQTAAMAIRFMLSMDENYSYRPAEQHVQGAAKDNVSCVESNEWP